MSENKDRNKQINIDLSKEEIEGLESELPEKLRERQLDLLSSDGQNKK